MGLFVNVLALVLLIACWAVGDLEFKTKGILTLVYLGTWLLLFVDGWAVLLSQMLFSFVVWAMTFAPTGRK